MDIVKSILGEAEEELVPAEDTAPVPTETDISGPHSLEVEELANLWTVGNKGEVVHRFMEMDNETSVELVFAIGHEGALELARMVDQMMEQNELPPADNGVGDESTEPEAIEPAAQSDSYPVGELTGRAAAIA